WCNDESSLHQSPNFEFLDEEARHNRLSGARIIGQQKTDAREFYEIVVDRLQLVRKRVHASDGKRKVGIVFVSETEAHGLWRNLELLESFLISFKLNVNSRPSSEPGDGAWVAKLSYGIPLEDGSLFGLKRGSGRPVSASRHGGGDPAMLGRFWVLILIALSRYASEALSWFPDGSGRCGIS